MKHVYNAARTILSNLRPVAIALACALLIFSSAAPALAFGNSNSKPEKGLEQLDGVQETSEEAITGSIDNANDRADVMKKSQEGLNGVQGAANRNEMKSPSNARGATSIEENIKKGLEEVTP